MRIVFLKDIVSILVCFVKKLESAPAPAPAQAQAPAPAPAPAQEQAEAEAGASASGAKKSKIYLFPLSKDKYSVFMVRQTDGKYRPFGGEPLGNENPIDTATRIFQEEFDYTSPLGNNAIDIISKWKKERIESSNDVIIFFTGNNDYKWNRNKKKMEGVWMTVDDIRRVSNRKDILIDKNYIIQHASTVMKENNLPVSKVILSENLQQDYDKTYQKATDILQNREITREDFNKAWKLAQLFMDHFYKRLNILIIKLMKNPDVQIIVPGNSSTNEHYLAKGIAVDQWKKFKNDLYSDNIKIVAWKIFFDYLTIKLQEIKDNFPNQVTYDTFDRTKASDLNIIVWGANTKNWEGENHTQIIGSGQAAAASPYGPGVFGIITTPSEGLPPLSPLVAATEAAEAAAAELRAAKAAKEAAKAAKEAAKAVNNKYLTYKNNFNQSKYYEKYLKYKLKYNQLKEKFN
jgi:hypothetical protein